MWIQSEMLQLFQNGHADEFFAVWDQFLPSKIRNEDAVAQKLEFYLNIYFAIYPLKHNQKVSFTKLHVAYSCFE